MSDAIPAAVRTLAGAGLGADTEAVARIFGGGNESAVASSFEAMIGDPVEENVRAFFEAARSELSERALNTARGAAFQRPESPDSTRDLALRVLLGAEYARAAGRVDPSFADYASWNATVLLNMSGVPDVREAGYAMIERRLSETAADEARWAATPEDRIVDDTSEDAASRHWTWAMLHAAMDHAAEQGRAGDVEAYALRYDAIPQGGDEPERARWRAFKRTQIEEARQRLERALARR